MKKYKTRSGMEVDIWTFNSHQVGYPIRGEIHAPDGSWRPASWTSDLLYTGCKEPSPKDLVEVHPCDGLKPGDDVAVSDVIDDSPVILSYIGHKTDGTVYTENIHTGIVQVWAYGEPA